MCLALLEDRSMFVGLLWGNLSLMPLFIGLVTSSSHVTHVNESRHTYIYNLSLMPLFVGLVTSLEKIHIGLMLL